MTEKFERVFAGIRSRGKLSESDVRETAKEVRRALLEADVNFRVVKDFVARVETRLVGEEVHKSFTPAQQIVRVVNEELTTPLGGTERLANGTERSAHSFRQNAISSGVSRGLNPWST